MKLTLKRKQAIWAYAFIILPLIFFILVRIFPVLFSFNISLYQWDVLSANKTFILFDNYKDLLSNKIFFRALKNTLYYVIFAVPIGLSLGLSIALLLNKITKGLGFFRMIFFIPYVTSSVAISWVWKWIFMKQGGVFNSVIRFFGMPNQPLIESTQQAIFVIIALVVWTNIGFYSIIFLAGLKQIPKIYYEASSIDGANKLTQFIHITIPLLNPTLVYLSVMSVISTLQVFTQIRNILPEGGPVNSTMSMVLYIYITAFKNYKMGAATAMTVVLFLIILSISLFQMKVLNKRVDY